MGRSLRIAVCMKQVLDPEAPASTLRIDATTLRVSAPGTPPLWGPYDLNALKLAGDLKRAATSGELGNVTDAEVVLLTAGSNISKTLVIKALASGADSAVILERNSGAALDDSRQTAAALAAMATHSGEFDLILTGRRAPDTNAGAVGAYLAELTGAALLSLATDVEIVDSPGGPLLRVTRLTGRGTEIVECGLPAVLTVSSEVGELGLTEFKNVIAAKKKPIEVLTPVDLPNLVEVTPAVLHGLAHADFERDCQLIESPTDREAGAALADELSGLGLIPSG